MSIAKVKLIDLTSNLNNLDRILMKFIDIKGFHPVPAGEIVEKVHGLTTMASENPCTPLLTELDEIERKFLITLPSVEERDEAIGFSDMMDEMHAFRSQLETDTNEINELKKHVSDYHDALIQVENIMNLDVPLDDLFASEYIKIRFGRLPNINVEKLRFFQNKPFVYKSFSHDNTYSWCMYFTTEEYKREIDNLFSSLFFERIYIPDFVHGTPKDAVESLHEEIDKTQAVLDEKEAALLQFIQTSTPKLSKFKGKLLFLNRFYEAKQYVVGLGDKFSISGFTEVKDVKKFKAAFKEFEDIEIDVNDAYSDRRIQPPTKIKNSWFTKPFSVFVEMYGLPSYDEIDPTPLFAITYSILFGAMFGDFGQGIVLMILGALLYHYKKNRLGAIGLRVGMASTFFGFLYGSFFGLENFLDPVYQLMGLSGKPVSVMDPNITMTMLYLAVGIGALLIVIAMIFNVIQLIRKKEYGVLIASHNGISGLLLYGYIITGIVMQLLAGQSIFNWWMITIFVGLPVILIFLQEPINRLFHEEKMFKKGFGGFFVEGFFELFEILLSYLTNTVSFIRVGGFILAHAGMMLVVMTLMNMAGSSTSWLVLILGNIFVMGLEGLIVGIQVLRLEFYEIFSRYYIGNGIAFNALNK